MPAPLFGGVPRAAARGEEKTSAFCAGDAVNTVLLGDDLVDAGEDRLGLEGDNSAPFSVRDVCGDEIATGFVTVGDCFIRFCARIARFAEADSSSSIEAILSGEGWMNGGFPGDANTGADLGGEYLSGLYDGAASVWL